MARDPLQAITDAETEIAARMELKGPRLRTKSVKFSLLSKSQMN